METNSGAAGPSRLTRWSGRILSILVTLLMIMSGVMKILKPAVVVQGFTHLGYPEAQAVPLGILEIGCAVIYLLPGTSTLGAVLLTGYLGGATATSVRVGDPWFAPVLVGVVAWAGLFLQERRLRALLPFRLRP